MIKAYVNYPNPKISMHTDLGCGNIQMQKKIGQRYIKINAETISTELRSFRDHEYHFAANPELNDMWLEIDFKDCEFEKAVAGYICALLGSHYAPFNRIKPENHC